VLAPDNLQRLALALDSLDVRSLRTRLAARAPGLRSVFAQVRARLVPGIALSYTPIPSRIQQSSARAS
jgi:hypothetical protein